jgi:hypothetical protein
MQHTRAIYVADYNVRLLVPHWFIASWKAGEPLNGLVDWLVEQYGSEYPWLEEAVRSPKEGD